MKRNIIGASLMFVMILVGWAVAQNSGSEVVVFEKGKMPQVVFPHHRHQQKLNNECNACHDLFPMQTGVIKEMILQEKLKKQQVMNSKCVKCHKDRVQAGLAAGPVKCTECHARPE
jgi:hypothetical protein